MSGKDNSYKVEISQTEERMYGDKKSTLEIGDALEMELIEMIKTRMKGGPKKYILTGGPGTGKSSIILALEQMGEYTIREAAEDYIKYKQASGQPEPWTEPDFQDRILDLQMQREERIHPKAERVFIDRGLADGAAYAEEGLGTYERIMAEAGKEKYEKIFIIENLGFTEKTEVRREDQEEAIRIGEKLEQIYKDLGYKPIRIPAGPVKERMKRILAEIE